MLRTELVHLYTDNLTCTDPEGVWGPDPTPWKITSYMDLCRNKHLTPPPPPPTTPLENVGPPLDPWESIVLSAIKPLDPVCKL